MRFLYMTDDGEIAWTKDIIRSEEMPRYAILSHTWGEQEVTFDDLRSLDSMKDIEANNEAIAKKKEGWDKIRFCAQRAKHDELKYFWVDTCCIDKANNTELSEAINSMFRWYQKSEKCYVFLSDVERKSSDEDGRSSSRWKAAFKASRWFTRGWTLQELLAPRSVEFFSKDGEWLGDKGSLNQTIYELTGIPLTALPGGDLSRFKVAERFSWAQHRQTTREEDKAYCLLGIFGCHLPLIYGEGREKAMKRLEKEVQEASESTDGALVMNAKIRNWLSAPDPSMNYNKAHKQREAETGQWLLRSTKLKKWRETAASRLWLYGIPGCGKTVLSSTIIEHLMQYCHDDISMVTVYFYFDFMDAQKQDPELMIRSLFSQLLHRSIMIPKDLDKLFKSCGDGSQQPPLPALLEVAPQMIRQFTHVYIALDALDECTQRLELMDILETVAGWQLDNVHLLMTSRKERDIEMSLETFVPKDDTICLQRCVVDEDILRFAQQRLRDDKRLEKWNKDASIRREIETALRRGAQGMFRWAVCQLDMIAKCRNLAMLRKSLATLPQTLDQTYDRILTAISEDDRVYAMRILQWLTFSARPLSVGEIAEVVALDIRREPIFDRDEVLVDPLEVLNICASLVTITNDEGKEGSGCGSRIITLAHYSVQEYLVSDRIQKGPAKEYSMQKLECHKTIAKGCLGYLNQFQEPISTRLLGLSTLAQYSARFWSDHLEEAGEDEKELSQLAMRLLSTENPAYANWIRIYGPDNTCIDTHIRTADRGSDSYEISMPLYYVAMLGLSKIAKLLIDQGAQVNAQNGRSGSALHAASFWGHKPVVELLITAGADINAICGSIGSALQGASVCGHDAIVQLLLDAGADANAIDGSAGSALQIASARGHNKIASKLLNAHKVLVRQLINSEYQSRLKRCGPADTTKTTNAKWIQYWNIR